VRTPAWHKLGVVLQNAPSIPEALRLARLDWQVRKEQLLRPDGRLVNRWLVTRDKFTCTGGCNGKGYTDAGLCDTCTASGVRAGLTPVRVVCHNTLSAAIDGKNLVRIFHTGSAGASLDAARDVILRANGAFDRAAEVYRALAGVKNVGPAQIRAFVDSVFPPP